jgi:FkbM family methyltransferase
LGIRRKIRRTLRKYGFSVPYVFLNDDEKYFHRVYASIKKDDTVIDIGAHIGTYSKKFAERARKVYAIEPHPEIYQQLTSNTEPYPNIETIQAAVSNAAGVAHLYSDASGTKHPTQGSTLSLNKGNVSYESGFEVESIRLSDLLNSIGKFVRLIKIDIEGMEYKVINDLLDNASMDKVGKIYVEDHCEIVEDLHIERAATLAKIRSLGLEEKFDFNWP